MKNYYETIVIGAGQAGLAVAYHLKKSGKDFILLDRNKQVGDSWRLRYDSLTLFTPRSHCSLPGHPFPGDQDGYPAKDEVAAYLNSYAKVYEFPIIFDTKVTKVTKVDGVFEMLTKGRTVYYAENVVVAAGSFRNPVIPAFAQGLSSDIFQIHSEDYRHPAQLHEGTVLIVGGGNSGMQIAAELNKSRQVYLAISKTPKFLPYEVLGRSIFWWLQKAGILKITANSWAGGLLQRNDPIIGTETKRLIQSDAIKVFPKVKGCTKHSLIFENDEQLSPDNIIWATGYDNDYSWIDIPSVIDNFGKPIHKRGVTTEKGLYFLGLSWQHTRGSALLMGAGDDAAYIMSIPDN